MALFTITINNIAPALDKKFQEVAVIAQYLNSAAQAVRSAGGQLTSGNILDNRGAGSTVMGNWNYESQVQPGSVLPLDGIATGIKAAYSTRQLLTAYAGKALNVIRASDSTTLDIGFVANVLDTASLATFCAGTTGSVNKWYDQSGGGFNMTPGIAPIIYQSGAVTAINGKPAPLFVAASSQVLSNASLTANPVNTLYQNAVVSPNTFNNGAISGPSGASSLEWRVDTSSGALDLIEAGIVDIGTSTNSLTLSTGAVAEAQYTSSTGAYAFWINRSSGGAGGSTPATLTARTLSIGGYAASSEYFDGLIGEYIAYDLVGGIPSASQTSIENNQKTYWGTP